MSELTSDDGKDGMKPMLAVLGGRPLRTPPIWLMRQAGRYLPEYRAVRAETRGFIEFCLDPARAAEVTLQPIRRFGFDAAIVFADILLIPHALGQRVRFLEGEGPRLDPLIGEGQGLGSLDVSRVTTVLAPVGETLDRVRSGLAGTQTALIGFAGAPWTVATYMIEGGGVGGEHAATRRFACREAETFAALLDLVTEATIRYLRLQVAAGAEILQLFDSWASGLGEALFERAVITPTRRIVASLAESHPGIPIIGFPRGAGLLYERYARETGVRGLGLDTGVPRGIARERLAPQAVLQGNLDPQILVAGGVGLSREIESELEAWAGLPYVFNLGHGIVPETPIEHVSALIARIRRG